MRHRLLFALLLFGGVAGLLARTDANGSTYYHSDGAGNITALMDGEENIVARYMYGPFGKLVGKWGSMASANEMQFSSMPRDSLSGLSFYPLRAYEPNFQRWLNQDPIQEWGGINLYRAMNNNPVNWVDPLGLDPGYGNPVSGPSGPVGPADPYSQAGGSYPNGYQYTEEPDYSALNNPITGYTMLADGAFNAALDQIAPMPDQQQNPYAYAATQTARDVSFTAATIAAGGALGDAAKLGDAAGAGSKISCPTSVAQKAVSPAVRNAMYNGGIENIPQAEREAAAQYYDQIAQDAQNPTVKAFNQARANYARNGGTPPGGIGNFQ